MTKRYIFVASLFLLIPAFLFAQNVKGVVIDADTRLPIEGVLVNSENDKTSDLTDAAGAFSVKIKFSGTLTFSAVNYKKQSIDFEYAGKTLDLGKVTLRINTVEEEQQTAIPTILLNDLGNAEDNDAVLSDNISGLLTASRDPFLAEAAFQLGQYRFRPRGYDTEHGVLMMNGVPMNELENGRISWFNWSGLNDVFRNQNVNIGLAPADQTFGGVSGSTEIDTRASSQRAQTRVAYAVSNRTYRNRLMATYATGVNENGWAFALSGSRRWAQEGFVEGTVFDGWAYFAGVSKHFNEKHKLHLTVFGSPTKRGRIGVATDEARDLAGTNFYNPLWGFQDGEKRNSRVQNSHAPTGMLTHDWQLSENSSLTTAVSYQYSINGQTRLDWFNRADPRPDYYRYLPSYLAWGENADAETVEARAQYLRDNPDLLQINWDQLYEENRNYVGTIQNANGIEGNTVTGNWSRTILEEQHFDSDEVNFAMNYRSDINDEWSLNLGARYQAQVQHTFREVHDLLGGEFFVDIDKFAEREAVENIEDFQQSDLNNPNRILQVGDRYGWNYDLNIRKGGQWGQLHHQGNRWEVFAAGEFESTQMWREGFFRNGRFPDSSEGESDRILFNNFGLKGGVTYKIDGRNYLYGNASYQTKAPTARVAFASPRTRNQITPNLESEKILSYEIGYNLRAPKFKGRLTAFWTRFEDQTRRLTLYNDLQRTFTTLILQNIDREHAGIEAALTAQVTSALSLTGVAAIGQNIFTSRMQGSLYRDNAEQPTGLFGDDIFQVYSDGFYVANGPQEAYTFKIGYEGKDYWFANLNFNYFDKIFTDFSPFRRTETAVFGLEDDPEVFDRVVRQEQLDSQFTVDFFGGKSFQVDKLNDLRILLIAGVSNILDNQEFRTGGFEQTRFNYATRNPDNFPPNYFYSFGRTFFIQATFQL